MSIAPYIYRGKLTESTRFGLPTANVRGRVAVRRADTGEVLLGGITSSPGMDADQANGFTYDETMWIESRAIPPHTNKLYEGFWAMVDPQLIRSTAKDLRFDEVVRYDGDDEIARVPAGQILHLKWDILFPEMMVGNGSWEWHIHNAVTGVKVPQSGGLVNTTSATCPALSVGSYLVSVNLSGVKKAYDFPSDWSQVTGKTTFPAEWKWIHPTLGEVQCDPFYLVGAIPYDPTNASQKYILDLIETNENSGNILKNPEWVGKSISFNNDGSQITVGGEYAMLKVVAFDTANPNAATWVGDSNCHISATPGPSLWKLTGTESNPIWTPVMVEPRIRSIGAFYEEEDGLFVIGCMIAGRSGRTPTLIKVQANTLVGTAHGSQISSMRWCECYESDECITGIIKYNGEFYCSSYCEWFREDKTKPVKTRLVPSHPGGRSPVVVRRLSGHEEWVRACESDFSSNKRWEAGHNNTLLSYAPFPGPPTTHHYDSILAVRGSVFGISGFKGFVGSGNPANIEEDPMQHLSRLDGQAWTNLASWRWKDYDMGRIVRWNDGLLAIGLYNDSSKPNYLKPMGFRVKGEQEMSAAIDLPVITLRAEPSKSADGRRNTAFLVGKKPVPNGGPGVIETGTYIYEMDTAEVCFGCECLDGSCHEFCLSQQYLLTNGINKANLPPFVMWNGNNFIAASQAPTDGTFYLVRVDGSNGDVCYRQPPTICWDMFSGAFCISRDDLAQWSIAESSTPAYLIWQNVPALNKSCWVPSATPPPAPTQSTPFLYRVLETDRICYHLGVDTQGEDIALPYDPTDPISLGNCISVNILGAWCPVKPPEPPSPREYCTSVQDLLSAGVDVDDLAPFYYWTGYTWRPTYKRPESTVYYLEKFYDEVAKTVCYRKPITFCQDMTCNCLCTDIGVLSERGINVNSLPNYLVYSNPCWTPSSVAPAAGTKYLYKHVSGITVCYLQPNGQVFPYDADCPNQGDMGCLAYNPTGGNWCPVCPPETCQYFYYKPDGRIVFYNIVDGQVEPCTCDNAGCWGDLTKKVGVFKWANGSDQLKGDVNTIFFQDISNEDAFIQLDNLIDTVWILVDEVPNIINHNVEGGDTALTENDLLELSKFDIRVPYGRDFDLPVTAKKYIYFAVVLQEGFEVDPLVSVVS
jgi:hypothetical protein